MIRGGIPIGKIFGISIKLHYSWFFIFALVTWALTSNNSLVTNPSWSLTMRISAGLVTSLLFFGSVLLHELMHSLVALKEGIQIDSITLFFLGGVSQMTTEPRKAKDEFRMAAAGPLTSLVLGGIFLGIWAALQGTTSEPGQFVATVARNLGPINVSLGVFNLVPGFPLDGGRVLRAFIWWRTGNLQTATRIASNIGRAVGFIFIVAGIGLIIIWGDLANGIWLALIGWFLQSAAVGSYRQLLLADVLRGHTANEVMSQDFAVVSSDISIERLVNENILTSGRRSFPVMSGDRIDGIITLQNIKTIPRNVWSTKLVREVMTPLKNLKSVRPDEDLATVLLMLAEHDINQAPVISDGAVVGMVGRDNIIGFVSTLAEISGSDSRRVSGAAPKAKEMASHNSGIVPPKRG